MEKQRDSSDGGQRRNAKAFAVFLAAFSGCTDGNVPDASVEVPDGFFESGEIYDEKMEPITDDTEGISPGCFRVIEELRLALSGLELLNDNFHIDNNHGPFIALLDQNNCASSLIDAAERAKEGLQDKCKAEKGGLPAQASLEAMQTLFLRGMCSTPDPRWDAPVKETGPVGPYAFTARVIPDFLPSRVPEIVNYYIAYPDEIPRERPAIKRRLPPRRGKKIR